MSQLYLFIYGCCSIKGFKGWKISERNWNCGGWRVSGKKIYVGKVREGSDSKKDETVCKETC